MTVNFDRAADWAYARLTEKARNGDRNQTLELARLFRREVIGDCYMSALVDIDEQRGDIAAHKIVLEVCKFLLELE